MKTGFAGLIALSTLGCSLSLPFEELDSDPKPKPPADCRFTFQPETRFPVWGYSWDVSIAHFDGDEDLDLAVAFSGIDNVGRTAGPEILLGDGAGGFQDWTGLTKFELVSHSIAAGDFNGDTLTDIAISYSSPPGSTTLSGSFDIELGDGVSNLDPGGIWTVPTADDIAVGDFNGDGRLDAAVITKTYGGLADEKLHIFRADETGALGPSEIFDKMNLTNTFNAVTASDFDLDGNSDLVVSHWGFSEFSVLMGASDGTFFVRGPVELVGEVPKGMASADFDEDGKPDLVVVNNNDNTFSLLRGAGDGTFSDEKPWALAKLPEYIVAADFDGDGHYDVAASTETEIAFRRGLGDGSFAETELFLIDGSPHQLAAADLNHDGLLDLAVANIGKESISVYLAACEPHSSAP